MRKEGTKYPEVKKYMTRMIPVSAFARQEDMAVGQIYMKYDRHIDGYPKTGTKGPYPGYIIRQFNGMNYVIPD